jgi:hypothetical protein
VALSPVVGNWTEFAAMPASDARNDSMTLRELLETLKCFGVKIALHDGDTIAIEPPEVLTPAVRAALAEHHAALVALIRSGPSSTSSFDTLLAGLDGLGARPPAEVLHECLRTLADGLAGADPLVRELVRAEAIARLSALGVRTPARIIDAALTARPGNSGGPGSGRSLPERRPRPRPGPAAPGGAPGITNHVRAGEEGRTSAIPFQGQHRQGSGGSSRTYNAPH